MKNLTLEDRMKLYESEESARRLVPNFPIMARIDGKNFSAFCSDMNKPFDNNLSQCMINVAEFLVKKTRAVAGYTQSDEISICWYETKNHDCILFNGRIQKCVSILASMATFEFARQIALQDYEKFRIAQLLDRRPVFDARIWSVPTSAEAANVFLWRMRDCYKNAISSTARAHFSSKQIFKKNGNEMREMLKEKGVNFDDYPRFFRRGTLIQKRTIKRKFDPEKDDLPEMHEARRNSDMEFERLEFRRLEIEDFATVNNREGVVLFGEDPIIGNY